MSIRLHPSPLLERPRSHRRSNAFVGASLVLFAACTSSLEPSAASSVKLLAISATQLTGTVGAAVDPAPSILLTDADGTPIPGATLSVEVTAGEGWVGTTDLRTDPFGRASTSWTLGRGAGGNTLTIRMSGTTALEFIAVAKAGPVRYVDVSGDGQVDWPGATLAERVSVKVQDEFINPVAGATVTFTVISGDGTIDESTAVSDSSGIARAGAWTLGPVIGTQRLRARAGAIEVILAATGVGCPNPIPGSCASPMELAFARPSDGQLYRIRSDGTGLTRLTRGWVNHDPAWSPDGLRIAFIRRDESTRRGDVWVMDADGTNAVQRTANWHIGSVSWSPDGTKLAVSPNGLYSSSMSIIDASGPLTNELVVESARRPAWSPDGRRIAFVRPSGDDGYETVWSMNADGTGQRQLTQPGGGIFAQLSWLSDGSGVVFTDKGKVFVANADGSGSREIPSSVSLSEVELSRDGNWLAVTAVWDPVLTITGIGYMPIAGGSPKLIVRDAYSASWRP